MSNRTALLGKKLGMSQVWDENGFFVPVTLVDVSTNVVTAVKSEESDGYKAVQLGYGQVDPTKVTKPLAGHFAKAGVTPRRHLAEVRTDNAEEFEPGQELTAELCLLLWCALHRPLAQMHLPPWAAMVGGVKVHEAGIFKNEMEALLRKVIE